MGNAKGQPYQNILNTQGIMADSYLINLCPLLYVEYAGKLTQMTEPEKNQMKTVLTALTDKPMIDAIKKDVNADQDYEKFITIGGEPIQGKVLVYSTIEMMHEVLQLIVYNRTELVIKYSPQDSAALVKEEKQINSEIKKVGKRFIKQKTLLENQFSKKEKKLDKQLQKERKKIGQDSQDVMYNSQTEELKLQFQQEQKRIAVTPSTHFYIVNLNYIQNSFTSKLLPVFAKYNYNVMNKKEYAIRYTDYLETRYRELLLALTKIFHCLILFKIKASLSQQEKYWLNYMKNNQSSMKSKNEDQTFLDCIHHIIDTQVQELVMQGAIMKMTVRIKVPATQEEDLDTSMDTSIDAVEVIPHNRAAQQNVVGFNSRSEKPQIMVAYKKAQKAK